MVTETNKNAVQILVKAGGIKLNIRLMGWRPLFNYRSI